MKFDTKEDAEKLADQILYGNSCKGVPNQCCMGCGEDFYQKDKAGEVVSCSAKCKKEVEQILERQ